MTSEFLAKTSEKSMWRNISYKVESWLTSFVIPGLKTEKEIHINRKAELGEKYK
jgi:hypothetical protein